MAHDDLIRRYEEGITAVEQAVQNIPAAVLDRPPGPGKWTIRQLIGHLADADLVAAVRMRFIAAEPGSPLKAFDQDKWAASLGYQHLTPEQVLAEFRAIRRITAAMLRSLPAAAWDQTGKHEERGEVTLRQMVESYAGHAEHHARQIVELKRQLAA